MNSALSRRVIPKAMASARLARFLQLHGRRAVRLPRRKKAMSKARSIEAALLAALLGVGAAGLSGCESQGPFEEAGEEVDDAADDVADEIEDEL